MPHAQRHLPTLPSPCNAKAPIHRTWKSPISSATSRKPWDGQFPLVEGHRGSLISGDCLTLAYRFVVLEEQTASSPATPAPCASKNGDRCWQSSRLPGGHHLLRCIRQGATKLHKDEDWDWTKPE